jgi:hypothetical protein
VRNLPTQARPAANRTRLLGLNILSPGWFFGSVSSVYRNCWEAVMMADKPSATKPIRRPSGRAWKVFGAALTSPIGLIIISFLLTGVAAAMFSKHLDDLSKAREWEFSARQRGIESVRIISDILYERRIRGVLVWSSISRNASIDELKDRKKSYDDAFVRWNSAIQSNMFRVREMFHAENHTGFELMYENNVSSLLFVQDSCLTSAYDSMISPDDSKHPPVDKVIADCIADHKPPVSLGQINSTLQDCLYDFTNALYRIIQRPILAHTKADLDDGDVRKIKEHCVLK